MKVKMLFAAVACIFSALAIFAPAASGQGSWYQCRSWGKIKGIRDAVYVTPFIHTDAASSTINQAYYNYMYATYPDHYLSTLPGWHDYCQVFSGDPGQRAFSLSTEEKQWEASKWEVIHIDWTYTPGASAAAGPPAVSSSPATSSSSASSTPAPQPTHKTGNGWAQNVGKVHHYYCSSDQGLPTIYFSAAFDTTDQTPGNMGAAYKQLLVQKYSYKSEDSVACYGSYATLDAVKEDVQKRIFNLRAAKKWKVVETGWTWAGSAP